MLFFFPREDVFCIVQAIGRLRARPLVWSVLEDAEFLPTCQTSGLGSIR